MCLTGRDGCYGCGENGHMMKDCPKAKDSVREGDQVASNNVEIFPQAKNRFYALRSKGDPQ